MTHLLHLDVEEGGGEENVSTILDRYTEANIESSDIINIAVGYSIGKNPILADTYRGGFFWVP